MNVYVKYGLLLAFSASLTACGGGGGGGSGSTPTATATSSAIATSSITSSITSSSTSSSKSSSSTSSSSSSAAPQIRKLSLSGLVTDKPLPNATLTFFIGSQTFSTTTDSQGKYQLAITPDSANLAKPIKAVAKGTGELAEIELVSLLPSFNTLLQQAGDDNLIISSENPALNVTNLTTAEFALIQQGNLNITTDSDLQTAQNSLNETNKLTLAALIKIITDYAPDLLPNNIESTLALVLNQSASENLLASINTTLIDGAIADTLNDSNITPNNALVGSWYLESNGSKILINFINNTNFILARSSKTPEDAECSAGAELGSYKWDKTNGTLSFNTVTDNNGKCGVTSNGAPKTITVTVTSNELTFLINGNNSVFKKVKGNYPLAGTWGYLNSDNSLRITSIFAEGAAVEVTSSGSMSFMTYTYNQTNGQFNVTIDGTPPKTNTLKLTTTDTTHFKIEYPSTNTTEIWTDLASLHYQPATSFLENTLTTTGGQSYPFRVNFTIDTQGVIVGGDYDFHKLDGTMTPCTNNSSNEATCHGTSSTIITSTQNGPLTIKGSNGTTYNGGKEVIITAGPDNFGYTFTGQMLGSLWLGTWSKMATQNAAFATSGTFSTKVVITEDSHHSDQLVTGNGSNTQNLLTSPNGSEQWKFGEPRTVTWKSQQITGTEVDLYLLVDDPTGLATNSQTLGALVNSKVWFKFASHIANNGSYTLDPATLNGTGNAYLVLIVSSTDNSQFDLSNNTFSISP